MFNACSLNACTIPEGRFRCSSESICNDVISNVSGILSFALWSPSSLSGVVTLELSRLSSMGDSQISFHGTGLHHFTSIRTESAKPKTLSSTASTNPTIIVGLKVSARFIHPTNKWNAG